MFFYVLLHFGTKITDENKLKKEILSWISPYVFSGIPKKITNLLDAMRVLAYSEPLPTYADRIFLANGTYYLSGEFEESRVGLVMRALLGDNMCNGSIQKVETNPFARADLEHLLAMVDDDMKLEALPQTNYIKTIVTAEQPLDLEKKGKQSYQGWLYSRFMVFGNGVMKSRYDRSEGFFRCQLILSVKEKEKDRYDDPFIAEKMCAEAEGILLWALEGLRRLIQQNYHFTTSERTKANREEAIRDGNNIVEFMESEGYFRFKSDAEISSTDFYAIYTLWCSENSEKPLAPRSFSSYIIQHEKDYNLEYSNNVMNQGNRRVRGFWGIEPLVKVFS